MHVGSKAHLLIEGRVVGMVVARGFEASWGYGNFRPAPAFSEYAPLFGTWSLLMHADEQSPKMTEALSEELRETEIAIDALKAELHWIDDGAVTKVRQLNIDGELIEWKM